VLVGRIVDGRHEEDAFRSLPPASVSRLSVGQASAAPARSKRHRSHRARPHQPRRRTGPGANDSARGLVSPGANKRLEWAHLRRTPGSLRAETFSGRERSAPMNALERPRPEGFGPFVRPRRHPGRSNGAETTQVPGSSRFVPSGATATSTAASAPICRPPAQAASSAEQGDAKPGAQPPSLSTRGACLGYGPVHSGSTPSRVVKRSRAHVVLSPARSGCA
jgi:hypothetical protein